MTGPTLSFTAPLVPGRLLRRYQRFLADVRLDDGRTVTAHVPNSGSMRSCLGPEWEVRLSPARNPARRLAWTLEMVHNGRCWIGVNTQIPNRLVLAACRAGAIPALAGYAEYRPEVPYGAGSRIDIRASDGPHQCFVEVKNVTLVEADGINRFPDAVTDRGRKHLAELTARVAAGDRGVMLYLVQRADGRGFAPARHLDPAYADALLAAVAAGVEVLAWRAAVSPEGIALAEPLVPDLLA